jgi:hypothetical protein
MKIWGVLNHFLVGHVGRHGPVNWARAVLVPDHQPIFMLGCGPFKKAQARAGPARTAWILGLASCDS